jgi:CHAT domain-containing protein
MNDELLTVAMALHHVGYPSVIATTWMIDDADALDVAYTVYGYLVASGRPNGGRAALAIHHETRRLRDCYPRQPSAWAAYLHIGLRGRHA